MTTPLLTSGTVNEVSATIQGDIGGKGISRFRFIRNDAGVTTVADCNAAGAAVRQFLLACGLKPSDVTWTVNPTVEMFDVGSALVQGALTMTTIPANVVGTDAGNYAAGIGVRVNWKTNTIVGRRMLKGCTFLVPMASSVFSASGAVGSGTLTSAGTAAGAYVGALQAANLVPVVWHRPAKGTTAGGQVGVIQAWNVSTTPAGLRSRRS